MPIFISHLTWTTWLGNNHPIPFVGLISWAIVNIVCHAHLWFEFPSELRKQPNARGSIRSYFLYRLWSIIGGFQFIALKIMFRKIPIPIQWIMSIILPLVRELNLWVLSKLLEKATNYDLTVPLVPKLTSTLALNIGYAFFIAMLIADSPTAGTSNAILAVDFIINLCSLFQIIKLHRKIVTSEGLDAEKVIIKKKEETLKLFAIEIVEFMAPLAYIITFLIAYYGPNATILGNIRNSDFAYKEVEDVENFVWALLKMFSADFVNLIISCIIFWKVASINFLQEGYKMMKVYWPFIAVKVGGALFVVIINNNYI
jgi:hypothetical protein